VIISPTRKSLLPSCKQFTSRIQQSHQLQTTILKFDLQSFLYKIVYLTKRDEKVIIIRRAKCSIYRFLRARDFETLQLLINWHNGSMVPIRFKTPLRLKWCWFDFQQLQFIFINCYTAIWAAGRAYGPTNMTKLKSQNSSNKWSEFRTPSIHNKRFRH
jgi:hypothetical protein